MQDYREERALFQQFRSGRKAFHPPKAGHCNPQAAKQKMESSSSISS